MWLDALDGVEDFEGEIVAASGEDADGIADQVIGDDGGDGSGESGGGGDESFGDAGSDGAQSCAAGGAEAVECVNDAPDRAEEADEGGDGSGNSEPGDVALEARDFFGGSDLHAALDGGEAAQGGGWSGELAFVFVESAFEDTDQRARTELIGDGGDILKALGFAEGAEEASTLNAGATEQAPLGEDDGPGDEAEGQQSDEDEFGDGSGAGDEIEYFAADEKC